MKILVHSIFYAPDLTGVAKYTSEMCEWLVSRGHEVTVITAPPHYPQWRVASSYRWWRYRKETRNGVFVLRSPLWLPSRPGGIRRILYALSFFLFSLPVSIASLLRGPDLIIAVEPSLFSAVFAWLGARATGAGAWLHIQDFEVDLAFDLGQLKRGRRAAGWIETLLLRRLDVVSAITPGMLGLAQRRGVRDGKAVLLRNWFDPAMIRSGDVSGRFRQDLGIGKEQLVVLFSGSLGAKQGLELIVEAARLTPAAIFIICGEGALKERLRERAAGLENIRFLDLQPADRLNDLLNAADVHLLTQDAMAAKSVLPSKLIGMLASGRPVVATARVGTEVAELVEGCGLRVDPGDPWLVSEAISRLAKDADERRRLGRAAAARAMELFRLDAVLPAFESQMVGRFGRDGSGGITRLATR